MEYRQGKLPFRCAYGRRVDDIQPGSSTEGPFLWTPRQGYPLLPPSNDELDATRRLAAPSILASTVDTHRIAARCMDVEKQFDKLVDAHLDLGDAIKNCSRGDIVGYEELEKKEKVEELQERGSRWWRT